MGGYDEEEINQYIISRNYDSVIGWMRQSAD